MWRKQFWGIVLIVLGGLALLQSMDIYYFGLSFWPVLLVILGLSLIYNSMRWGTRLFGLAAGIWLGGIGLFDILSRAGVTGITGGMIARSGWPLLLIAIGVSVLTGRRFISVKLDRWADYGAKASEYRMVGDLRYGQGNWRLDQDLHLEHGVGDVKVDLTSADIPEGEHLVTVKSAIGEVLVRVPDNVNVEMEAKAGIGDLEVFGDRRSGLGLHLRKYVEVPGATTTLRIMGKIGIGNIRIVQGPSYTGRRIV